MERMLQDLIISLFILFFLNCSSGVVTLYVGAARNFFHSLFLWLVFNIIHSSILSHVFFLFFFSFATHLWRVSGVPALVSRGTVWRERERGWKGFWRGRRIAERLEGKVNRRFRRGNLFALIAFYPHVQGKGRSAEGRRTCGKAERKWKEDWRGVGGQKTLNCLALLPLGNAEWVVTVDGFASHERRSSSPAGEPALHPLSSK